MEHKVSAEEKGLREDKTAGVAAEAGGQYRKLKRGERGRGREKEREKESESHKVKSLRLIELEVTDRVPSAPGATNLMQLLYNSLCWLALTTNRTISEIELPPRKFSSPSPPPSSHHEFWIALADPCFRDVSRYTVKEWIHTSRCARRKISA